MLARVSRHRDAFHDDSEQIGLLVTRHAAVAFAGAQKVDNLHRALDTRDLIGQAKGILMERHHIDGERAVHRTMWVMIATRAGIGDRSWYFFSLA